MVQRRVILTRPPYRGRNGTPVPPGTSSPTTAPTTHAHAARGTTTTNVVSVVPSAVREREAAHAHASDTDSLLEAVRKLSKEQRKEILDRLAADALLDPKSAADRDIVMWTEAVHRELVRLVGSSGGDVAGPVPLRKLLQAGNAWGPVSSFMTASKLADLQVNERQRAYYLLAQLLVRHARYVARKSGAPLSAKLVANCTGSLAGVFEDAFPGYLEAGLAPVICRTQVAA